MNIGFDAPRVLTFDFEARPIAFYGGDYVTKQITAVASAYIDDPVGTLEDRVLTKDARSFRRMLKHIVARFEEADVLVGHYIRGFDLPLLNANLFHEGLPLLGRLEAIDTKGGLPKMHGISKSMENLGATLGLHNEKVQMNTEKWWQANTLTLDGIEEARTRVRGDVLENAELFGELLSRGALAAPKVWDPGPGPIGGYTP